MCQDPSPMAPESRRHWARIYALVAVSAVLIMAALWWFTASYNIPMPAGR